MGFLRHFFLIQILMLVPGAHGTEVKFAGQPEMNGIRFEDYAGFEKKWPLITVRFRTDTEEQRFTFANEKAAQALDARKTDYPDGAVFAKIGIATQDDPAFASSKAPSGAKRYQFMIRDRKKYAATGGWGYALFNESGVTFDEDPAPKILACYACHKIVPDRGEVFSQRMELGTASAPRPVLANDLHERLTFADVDVAKLPDRLRERMSATASRVIEGPLSQHLFQGTLDEIRPALIAEAARSRKAAMLVSLDRGQFSAVIPVSLLKNRPSESCPAGKVALLALWTIPQADAQGRRTVRELFLCR